MQRIHWRVGRYFFSTILLFSSGLSVAQVYSWQDELGRTHYGDKPPEQLESRAVALPNTGAPSVYVWIDQFGQTHYASQPPDDQPSQQVMLAPKAPQEPAPSGEHTLYMWYNAAGQAQYGDRPPPGVEAQPLSERAPPLSTINR